MNVICVHHLRSLNAISFTSLDLGILQPFSCLCLNHGSVSIGGGVFSGQGGSLVERPGLVARAAAPVSHVTLPPLGQIN